MKISVKLEAFEGPLDLLLNLIIKNKVNIYDIPIVTITEQYMEYVNAMDEKNLDIMSEFLVMAATLLNIKSKMLLPKQEEDEETVDPRKELVERLLEYRMYKYISYELKDKQIFATKSMFKKPTIPKDIGEYKEEINLDDLLTDISLSKLHTIFKSVIKKQEDKIDPIRSKFGQIEKEEINLSDKIIYVEEYAKLHRRFSFRNLLEGMLNKVDIVVTFMSVLELMKTGKIFIVQTSIFDDILISINE